MENIVLSLFSYAKPNTLREQAHKYLGACSRGVGSKPTRGVELARLEFWACWLGIVGFLVYNHVHHDVMALAWDVADYLEGEGEANLLASDVGQEAVVVAFASAKPFAV